MVGTATNKSFVPTPDGLFEYDAVPLYHGRRQIDKVNAAKNLLAAAEVFEQSGIQFGLIYGTLLGAVRDNDFIDWDEDIDLYILQEQLVSFHNSLWLLRDEGFELVRCDDGLYSIMRADDYIDIYVFRKVGNDRICGLHVIPEEFLRFNDVIRFKGRNFYVPDRHVKLLERLYGKTWKQPKQNSPAQPYTATTRLALALKHHAPLLHSILRKAGRWVGRP